MKWAVIDEQNGLIEGLNYGPLLYGEDGVWEIAEDVLAGAIWAWLVTSADSVVAA